MSSAVATKRPSRTSAHDTPSNRSIASSTTSGTDVNRSVSDTFTDGSAENAADIVADMIGSTPNRAPPGVYDTTRTSNGEAMRPPRPNLDRGAGTRRCCDGEDTAPRSRNREDRHDLQHVVRGEIDKPRDLSATRPCV